MRPTLEPVSIAPMTQDEAEEIADWHYLSPYDFYDWSADANDLAELLDPVQRRGRYFAARDTYDDLVGFFGFGCAAGVVTVGVGLRRDLTGRGLGLAFFEQGLDFARARFDPGRFKLAVAAFNERAVKVYERAGFAQTRSFEHQTNGGSFPFVEMERRA